jgi:uncharacterized protein (DUF433 family)
MSELLQRITCDPDLCHGKPCIRGLRYPVEFILELLSSGMTIADILADYDDLEQDDIHAVLLFAARLSQGNIKNAELKALFASNLSAIVKMFEQHSYIEMSRDLIIIHQ